MRAPRALAVVLLLLASTQGGQTQGDPPGLSFFKNFFVTGNYVAASVDFGSQSGGGGFVQAQIDLDQPDEIVPADADIVAAFLYWQTIVDASPLPVQGLQFRGHDISEIAKQVASVPLLPGFSPCWSGGGQGTYVMKTFRADVLRYLPVPADENGAPLGKRLVNLADLDDPYPNAPGGFGPHTIRLPDNGTGNQTPQTAGASLLLVYRLPAEPLTSIVLYDGLQMKPSNGPATQTLRGFYQAASSPTARLTMLVGTGAKNPTEQVRFGRGLPTDVIIATNPFFTRESPQAASDRAWDGPTWNVGAVMPSPPATTQFGDEVTVRTSHLDPSPADCLATSAMAFSTTVADADFDGLLDVWETGQSTTHEPLLDPFGQPLPNLYAMGANPQVQDLFIEVGFMSTGAYSDPLNPAPGGVAAHSHLPSQSVLDSVAGVFANAAPRRNPANPSQTLSGPIKVRFDVGNRYQSSPNVIKFTDAAGIACAAVTDPACLSRGGEQITEAEVCAAGSEDCSFPGFRGVVGWKLGFRLLRDQPLLPLNADSTPPTESQCEAAGAGCVRRFDSTRRHMFRYALFAHALGIHRDDDPETAGIDESRYPRSISGVSDAGNGGGDFMVTLGFWDNFTGTPFMQQSTLVHEIGHTAGLRHGGSAPTALNPSPNCKPNYLSVMSYLFQVRGLIGPTGPTVDLSRQVLQLVQPGGSSTPLKPLDESALTETALRAGTTTGSSAAALFPTRWYAPKSGSYLDGLAGVSASTRHCDGTPLDPAKNPADAVEMIRVDGAYPVGSIDWNANGALPPADPTVAPYSQDINFNGDGPGTTLDPAADGLFTGWNDWERLDLRQTGSRRNPAFLSLEITVEDLAAAGDPGYGDPGYGDPGYGDPGYGDPGYGDPGYGDPGYGDPGYGDPGYGDPGYGDPGYGGELDVPTAESQGPAANSLSYTTTNQSIDVKWLPPPAGGPVVGYHVWKSLGPPSPSNPPTDVTPAGITPGTICNTTTQSIFCDTATQRRRTYYYFVVTWFASGKKTRSEIMVASR